MVRGIICSPAAVPQDANVSIIPPRDARKELHLERSSLGVCGGMCCTEPSPVISDEEKQKHSISYHHNLLSHG